MNWIIQGQDTCCFVYAAANLLVHEGRPVPNLEHIKDIACCRTGGTISEGKVMEALGLDLQKTTNEETVFKQGGILTIQHPLWNLHSVFIAPKREGVVTAVNSFLGPVECTFHYGELKRFIPSAPNRRHYAR